MSERDIFMQLFNISINTYYLWKKQERPIIKLIDKYFTKKDLEEFLRTGKIFKFDRMNLATVLEDSIYEGVLDSLLFDITKSEFIIDFIHPYKDYEKDKDNYSKNGFTLYVIENLDDFIEEVNIGRETEDDKIIDKSLVLKGVLDVLNELSEREFKHIVLTADFFNPFNSNYTK